MVRAGYKQTEVGVIPEDWEVSTLCKLALVIDSLHQTPSFENYGYAMVRVSDIKEGSLDLTNTLKVSTKVYKQFTKNYIPKKNNIVLSRVGSYGVSSFVDTNELFCMGQNTVVIEPKINPKLFFYLINTPNTKDQIENGSFGSGYKSLSLKNIKSLLLAYPTKEKEQTAIATALSDIDALITTLTELIDKKRQIKTATMQQLLTGKQRLAGFGEGKGMKQTELGEIPEDWEVIQLGKLGYFSKGRGIKKDEAQSGEIPCIRYGEIYTYHNDIIRDFNSHISEKVAKTSYKLKINSLLFAGSGETKEEIGKCIAFISAQEVYAGGDIVIQQITKGVVKFLGYLLNTPLVVKQKANKGQGDAVVHISSQALSTILIALPPESEQQAIAQVLSDMDDDLNALETRLAKTKAIKQGMMQELLTGRTRLI